MERTHILFGFTFLSVLSQALWKFVKIFYHVGNVPEQHTGANFAMIQSLQGSNNMIQSLQGSNIPMIQSIASELKFCMDTNAERGSDGLEEYLPLLLNDELPSSLGQKCFLTCLFNRFGLLKDGFLDTQTAKTLVDTFYKDRHDEKTMANIAINVCHVAAVPDVLNPCEIGFSLKSCFVDSKKKGKELRGRN